MRFRSTVALLAVALAIGCYIYFFERKTPSTDEARDLERKLLSLESGDVDKVRLAKGDSSITCEKKIDGTWEMTSPLKAKANSSQVEGIISRAASLPKERELELAAGDAAKYGLEKPRGSLSLWSRGAETTIDIGDESPLGDNIYVSLEGKPLAFLVPKGFATLLEKDADDLRDRTILDISVPEITSMQASRDGEETKAVKEDGHWKLLSPVEDRADDEKANSILKELRGLRALEFVTDEPGDLAEYGLSKPPLDITLSTDKGAAGRVSFGSSVKGNEKDVYATREGSETVFAVAKSAVDNIEKNVRELRSDRLFRAGKGEIQGVTIRRGEDVLALRKEGKDWKISEPVEFGAETSRVDALVGDLAGARITEFCGSGDSVEKKYGLEDPGVEISLQVAEGGAEEAFIGKVVKKVCYARRGGEKSVLAVDGGLASALDTDYLPYVKREMLSFDKEQVQRLTLKRKDGELACERKGPDDWTFSEPGKGTANGRKLDAVLVFLSHLRAKSIVARTGDNLRKYGLSEPSLEARVELKGGKAYTLLVGRRGKGEYYAMVGGGAVVFTVPDSVIDTLEADMAESETPAEGEGGE